MNADMADCLANVSLKASQTAEAVRSLSESSTMDSSVSLICIWMKAMAFWFLVFHSSIASWLDLTLAPCPVEVRVGRACSKTVQMPMSMRAALTWTDHFL